VFFMNKLAHTLPGGAEGTTSGIQDLNVPAMRRSSVIDMVLRYVRA
jgi:hypothetical protein